MNGEDSNLVPSVLTLVINKALHNITLADLQFYEHFTRFIAGFNDNDGCWIYNNDSYVNLNFK